tara:strand:- start:107 stop:1138 length:1032 start_codon:yes stop_codon:yes gene_type:complete
MVLTDRQQSILNCIVIDHIKTANPIASESIANRHDLGISPATIRNDVAKLEDAGYITRPHLSAGSVPLDSGYRSYVEHFFSTSDNKSNRFSEFASNFRRKMSDSDKDLDSRTQIAASMISRILGTLALVTFPKSNQSKIKHLEFVYLNKSTGMLIVVLDHTKITKRIIKLSNNLTRSEFDSAFNTVKDKCIGLKKKQLMKLIKSDIPNLENLLLREIFSIMTYEDRELGSDHYLYGLKNILAQPEFTDINKGYSIVEVVEDGRLAEAVVSENPRLGVLQIRIGRENKGDFLWPLSVIMTEYGIVGESVGLLGVIGPTRMDYTKAITIVDEASKVMSQMVEEVR